MIDQMPPWRTPEKWQEANRTLAHLVRRYQPELERAVFWAGRIQVQLISIFPLIDELCISTCPWCPDPCCLNAKIWIDFQDLLFLHLSGQVIPSTQMLQKPGDSCRYWSPGGCTLARIVRPWICTWYLCPFQMTNFRQQHPLAQKTFKHAIQTIKTSRKKMEAEFIQVVA